MSRGPGRIERAIAAILDGEADNAFTTEDLCERVYSGVNRVEKKHRVAVLRAANRLVKRAATTLTAGGLITSAGRACTSTSTT
jgi:hypothetical protein